MSDNNDKTVYILDSYGLIYRAYFALISHPLTNSRGENIGALSIFFRNLKALLSKYKPAYLAAAFDSRTPTFRHQMYAEYKATRQKTPDDLHAQVPWIEGILHELKVPVLRVDGFEADDIIATVAKKCRQENRPCRILSGDKDLLQLVNEQCKEMQPDKFHGGWVE
ncbi:MAG: DNA polymerase I, partial [Treponema sp.]|nr:DNA polymerase I [Treponema sp.]